MRPDPDKKNRVIDEDTFRSLYHDRRTATFAYRGAIIIIILVNWIKGKLYAKNQGPDLRDEQVISCIVLFNPLFLLF